MQRHALFLAALLIASTQVEAQVVPKQDRRLVETLRGYIPVVMEKSGTPGLQIALARRGKLVWQEGFGFADLESKRRMDAKTVMHSGSMGKLYTATAVMQLVEQGVLKLDDPINQHLQAFKVKNPLGPREVTVTDLLTHRSGLGANAAGSTYGTPPSLRKHLARGYAQRVFKSYGGQAVRRWTAPVGAKYQYSNFGIATLGYLVEITNPQRLSFSKYVETNIMKPLGMSSSSYPPVQDRKHVPKAIFDRMSTGYTRVGSILVPTPTIHFADYPSGTAVFTAADHLRLLLAFQNGGALGGRSILKPKTVKQMLEPTVDLGSGAKLGLAWFLYDVGKPKYRFGHAGAHMYGWRNDSRMYPRQGFGLVVATNQWALGDKQVTDSSWISEFISSWVANESTAPASGKPWRWKISYVAGLLLVEKMRGALGIDEPITKATIDAMCAGRRDRSKVSWDEAGFRQGVSDLKDSKLTLTAFRSFLRSKRLKVSRWELEFIFRQLGHSTLPATWR